MSKKEILKKDLTEGGELLLFCIDTKSHPIKQ
jgi:hypothetical protein